LTYVLYMLYSVLQSTIPRFLLDHVLLLADRSLKDNGGVRQNRHPSSVIVKVGGPNRAFTAYVANKRPSAKQTGLKPRLVASKSWLCLRVECHET
jgi:hypothetical protein